MAEPRIVLWRGELVDERSLRRRGLALVAPGAAIALLLVAAPCALMAVLALLQRDANGAIVAEPTLGNLARLVGFETGGWSASTALVMGRTALLAGASTLLAVALAYPLCFVIAARSPRVRFLLLALIAIPFCTNLVVRTHGWMLLGSSQLWPAQAAAALGLIDRGQALYPGLPAILVGMVSTLLPFAVLPLYPSVERLDRSLVDAAHDLGASPWGVFRHAILPQTRAGLAAALVLTFIPALGIYLVPSFLGGGMHMLAGELLQAQFFTYNDWPYGSAVACALVAACLIGLALAHRAGLRLHDGPVP